MDEKILREKAIDNIKKAIKEELNISIDIRDNLIQKGLSSIQVMKISGGLRKLGFIIPFAKLMESPTIEKWEDLIENTPIKVNKKRLSKEENLYDEFPLTDIQYAYLIGREDNQVLGGIGCHAYLEIDGANIKVDKLKSSWNKLQYFNPMLRVKFNDNGTQQIMKVPFSEDISVYDFRLFKENELENRLLEIRKKLSHRKLKVKEGEVAGLNIAILPENKYRIFLDVDLLVADVMSLNILIDELSKIYNDELILESSDYTFKDYLKNRKFDEQTMKEDEEFWKNKILTFPKESPNLPLKKKAELIDKTIFSRRRKVLDKFSWKIMKEKAAKYKVTPSMVLLTCYSMIIERWINQDKFVINIPLFNRETENANIKNMIADFTSLLLVECERKENETLLEKIRTISRTFLENVSHSSYSGVKVQRDIYKEVGKNINIAPIVFACNIDYPLETEKSKKVLGEITYMISQTPQVWLDFQTYVVNGELILCWDVVDELYHEGMIDDMFDAFYELLYRLIENDNWDKVYDVLTESQKEVREKDFKNILPLEYPKKTLYNDFIEMVNKYPDNIAIIDTEIERKITYKEVYDMALLIASKLISNGVNKGDYVGITLHRGYKQIIGILAILFSGAAYVPIGINQPKGRRNKIYKQIGIKHVLSDENVIKSLSLYEDKIMLVDIDDLENIKSIKYPVEISCFDTVYVIMTSGTTGIPKGVEIAHNSVINTIIDINKKYNICSNDTIIMVSAIDFDLSVYDIFGLLSVGGTVITLNDHNFKDPDVWIKLIEKYDVTLWNSVPIIFDMLITMAEGKDIYLPIKTVLLSGDWIATTLPGRFYSRSENSIVVGMGGATEASIWSNYINIPKEIPNDWISVPYGSALKNQVYRVIDDLGRVCPNYVKGELIIGGVGVAKGYIGDKKLTKNKFIQIDGIKWYKTGDMGRTWNDGTIEFLGRVDNQVKIKGHRIELGEIEDSILKNPNVKNVIVEVLKIGANEQLTAFIEPNLNDNGKLSESSNILKEEIINTKVKYENYRTYLEKTNIFVISTILSIFSEIGLFKENNCYTFSEIIEIGCIKVEYEKLILRWLLILEKYTVINFNEGKYSLNKESEILNNILQEDTREIYNLGLLKSEILNILQGKKDAIDVFFNKDFKLSPIDFLRTLKNYDKNIQRIMEIVGKLFNKQKETLRILELGGRDAKFTKSILEEIEPKVSQYIYCDNSLFFKDEFENIESKYDIFEFKKVNLEDNLSQVFKEKQFDLVILYNSLHRFNDIAKKVKEIKNIIVDEGFIIGTEINDNSLLCEINAAILERGFENFDLSRQEGNIIPNREFIKNIFCDNRIEEIYISDYGKIEETGNFLFIGRKAKCLFSSEDLKILLKDRVPEYMIPHEFIEIEQIPLNKNGKVDRKKLKELIVNNEYKYKTLEYEDQMEVSDETTKILIEIWKEILLKDEISLNSNYFYVGGDSLMATKLIAKVKEKLNIEISIGDVFSHPVLKELASFIDENKEINCLNTEEGLQLDFKNKYEPFNLTDVQFAYWIGRSGAYSLGSVSTHCYFELDCFEVKVERLQKIINNMIREHDMLRAIILKNGKQQILNNVPPFILIINDISSFEKDEQKVVLMGIREEMSHEILKTDKWPLFKFKVSILSDNKLRLHISFDNIILDGWSMFHILGELKERYDNENFILKNPGVSFRDYVLTLEKMKKSSKYEEDKNYWLSRIDDFLEAPKFEFIKSEYEIKNQIFKRREKIIECAKWEKLKKVARENNITPTIFLITIFSEVLRKYSLNKEFVLNITQFSREQIHPKINDIVGDFTTLTFLEVKNTKDNTLISKAKSLQKQLTEDINHRLYSAVEFGRELRLKRNNEKGSLMPIVFTSGLGLDQKRKDSWIGELVYNISQTPQVWLDHQVVEEAGNLKIIWDSVDKIFPEGLLDEMFSDYIELFEIVFNANTSLNINTSIFFENSKYRIKSEVGTNNTHYSKIDSIDKTINENESEEDYYENTSIEVIEILQKVLNIESIKFEDDFFKLGGNSLNAVQFINLINNKYGINISMLLIAENSLVSKIVKLVSDEITSKMKSGKDKEEGFI
ncbi:TPA: non-ribosomal peptide synthetase [Clostridioides difficile]|uniref:non-ribosomal peptide synthetase n=1 Tax=Clostridioides difficile TaxID=1496 RepID=UPI000C9C80EA|nr:non-ribosomal peptide synthetase [Clostridioides difficile]HBG7379501.1 non-ribosomal peptide synthetase [Clostridioides difficile]